MINMGPDSFRAAQPATARSGRGLWRNGAKRAFETLLILLTAPVTLPLMLLMEGLVALDGHNPFFAQKRIGRNAELSSDEGKDFMRNHFARSQRAPWIA